MIERKKRPKAKKKSSKIWSIREKYVLLHRLSGRKVLMVTVVQLVRASDCGSECRGFESHRSPFFKSLTTLRCEGFFSIYLLPLSFLAVRLPNRGAIRLRSLSAPGMPLSSCLAFVVAAECAERFAPLRKVPLAYLPARTRAPMPVAADNALPRFIVVCEAGQIVSLGGGVMPRRRCVSRKTVGCC